jgi:Competence protein
MAWAARTTRRAAQIGTTPIIATSFDQVSVIGVLTNLVAVPISGPILTLGLLGTLAGNVLPPVALPHKRLERLPRYRTDPGSRSRLCSPDGRRCDAGGYAAARRALLSGLRASRNRWSRAPEGALAKGRGVARAVGGALDRARRRDLKRRTNTPSGYGLRLREGVVMRESPRLFLTVGGGSPQRRFGGVGSPTWRRSSG